MAASTGTTTATGAEKAPEQRTRISFDDPEGRREIAKFLKERFGKPLQVTSSGSASQSGTIPTECPTCTKAWDTVLKMYTYTCTNKCKNGSP